MRRSTRLRGGATPRSATCRERRRSFAGVDAGPVAAQHAHADKVHVTAGAPHMLAQPPFLDEADGAVGADAALVVPPHAQEDLALVAVAEGILDQRAYGIAAIAVTPV